MKHIFNISVLWVIFALISPLCGMQQDFDFEYAQAQSQSQEFETAEKKAAEKQLFSIVFKACNKDASEREISVAIKCIEKLVREHGVNIDALHSEELSSREKKKFFNSETADLTPLVFAIGAKKPSLIKALLDLGANVNFVCSIGTPLDAAVTIGNVDVIADLVKRGAEINAADAWGQTPLFTVLYRGDKQAFDALYQFENLDCTRQENLGQTPLHFILLRPNPSREIIQKLMARGASPHAMDRFGRSAIDLARLQNYEDIVALFEGKQPSKKDNWLSNTIAAPSEQAKFARQVAMLKEKAKKKKQRKQKKHARQQDAGDVAEDQAVMPECQSSSDAVQPTSPTKKTKPETGVDPLTPTKVLRDGLNAFKFDENPTRRQITFEDIPKVQVTTVTADTVDPRVKDWFNNDFLRQEYKKYGTLQEFKRSVYYHQIPLQVMNCLIKHGKPEPRASDSRPDDIGTRWYLRGQMVFEDSMNNPWCPGKQYQSGFYHCTMNTAGKIYHVGFDPVREPDTQLSAFLPKELQGQEHIFKGFYAGITHQFKM